MMENRIEKLCADKGLRMTNQRRVIARVLSDAEDHPSVPDVHRRAVISDPSISIATVYLCTSKMCSPEEAAELRSSALVVCVCVREVCE